MASQLEYTNIVKQVQDRKATSDAKDEEEILCCMRDMDGNIAIAINLATSMPVGHTYPHPLDTLNHKKAWQRLTAIYSAKFGDKCKMTTFTQETVEYNGSYDYKECKLYGQFTLV
jgi:hypothetical protein